MEIKCPKCGSTSFDSYDSDCSIDNTFLWYECYCDNCGAEFKVHYIAVEVEAMD